MSFLFNNNISKICFTYWLHHSFWNLFTISPFHRCTVSPVISPLFVASHHHFSISSQYSFTILPVHYYTIPEINHITIAPFHHCTIKPFLHGTIKPLQHFIIALRVGWKLPEIKHLQYKSSYVSSDVFDFWDNGIESLHLSMSISEISLLCFNTEPFLICTPVLKWNLVSIIDVTFHIYRPSIVLQTINISTFKVKK